MALATEIKGSIPSEVLQYTIPVQILEDVPTQRVSTQHSLSYPFIERNMNSNKVAEMRFDGKRWVLVVPHGAYTRDVHLMVMRWEPDYTPDFVSVRTPEGKELMPFFADLGNEILKRRHAQAVIFGYHSSPYSLLQEGHQSVPTMVHPYMFDVSDFTSEDSCYKSLVKRETLTHKERKALRGGIYNREFGSFLVDHALNGQFRGDSNLLNRLFVMDKAEVDYRGVRVPTRGGLTDTLRTSGFFEGFLQPFAAAMNQFAEDLSTTFTDFNLRYVRARIEEAVLSRKEPDDEEIQAVLVDITKTPQLLERPQRAQNIQLLREKGYSDKFVSYLEGLSDRRLPYSGLAERFKRGFAYTFALGQDTETGQGFMAISVGVENGPGGVIESVLGAKLVRPPSPFSREEMEIKMAVYREIVGSLNGYVVQMPEPCPVRKICSDFRRGGRRRNGQGCAISGTEECPNNQVVWDGQYDRYLDARLDGSRPPVRINFQRPRLQRVPPYLLQEQE